jgi:hypothetical protein
MKKVLNDQSAIAHLWANKQQSEARNSNNSYYFYDNTIYSYGSHFPIAKHVINEAGEIAVLFTTRTYSNTTAKHINITRQSVRNRNIIYCNFPDIFNHSSNLEHWYNAITKQAEKLDRAKKPELYLNEIDHLSNQAKKYIEFFNLSTPVLLDNIMKITGKEQFKEFNEKREQLKKIEEKLKQKEQIKAHKKQLEKFYSFEVNRVYSDIKKDFLRFNIDNNRVETTQGVQIPIEAAKRLYNSIVNNTLKVGENILNYSVDYIDTKIVKIGCHNFDKKYLLTFGKTI